MGRAKNVIQTEGWRSLFFKILGELFYRRVWILETSLQPRQTVPTADTGFTVQELRPDNVDEYCRFKPGADPNPIQSRLSSGERCFVVRVHGQMAHATWVARKTVWIEYLGRWWSLPPSTAYLYETFTAPAWRGQGIAKSGILNILETLATEHFTTVTLVVMPENRVAFHLFRSMGFDWVGTLRVIKMGPWRWDLQRRWSLNTDTESQHSIHDSRYWDHVIRDINKHPYKADHFIRELKKSEYLNLLDRWGGPSPGDSILKTDLYEEALDAQSRYMEHLSTERSMIVGMDISFDVARQASLLKRSARTHYVVADLRHHPFRDGVFDFILSPSSLDHFNHPGDLHHSLGELVRVMTDGGRMLITLDNRQNITDPLLRLLNALGLLPFFLGHTLTIKELRQSLRNLNLTIMHTTAILHNPRLFAAASLRMVRLTRCQRLVQAVERLHIKMQRLGETDLRYWTGSFIAAMARKPENRP
jgi:SAM-dependent methyltransferase